MSFHAPTGAEPLPAAHCPLHASPDDVAWSHNLPGDMATLVVTPVSFDIEADTDAVADRVQGYDSQHQPCYRAYRYLRTELRSDDDESFYETPVYAETVQAWRLADTRWLVRRTQVDDFDSGNQRSHFQLQSAAPR